MSTKKNPPAITPTTIRRPPSEAQLRANRLNAQKSTGPRTEEGKQRASLNATRHGLTAQVLTLTPEELKALQALIGDFEKQYQPATTQEKHLVHMLGQLQFRLHRIMATEHNLFAIGITENSELWDVNHPEARTAFVLAETLRRASRKRSTKSACAISSPARSFIRTSLGSFVQVRKPRRSSSANGRSSMPTTPTPGTSTANPAGRR